MYSHNQTYSKLKLKFLFVKSGFDLNSKNYLDEKIKWLIISLNIYYLEKILKNFIDKKKTLHKTKISF